MITGKQLVELGIITGEIGEDNIAQHGVDLNVVRIQGMLGVGYIPKAGRTELVKYLDIEPNMDGVVYLKPGAYNVTFKQGCKIPADKMLLIRQRSSLLRNGAVLHSSVFDAGFETEQIGSVLIVAHPIDIQLGARIAQIYAHDSNVVENLYNGQFQNDQQREEENND